ncbi:hypothetical protein BHM03_00033077 [Ensete ventricosum]|nr:hypothetical protein BHM03_00033077 [Ensete ventricosum]
MAVNWEVRGRGKRTYPGGGGWFGGCVWVGEEEVEKGAFKSEEAWQEGEAWREGRRESSGLGSTQVGFGLEMRLNCSMPRIRCTHGPRLVEGIRLD